MSYRNYANTNGFIVSQNNTADFTTITAAIAAINAKGLTKSIIYISNPTNSVTTFTENFTLPAGCHLSSLSGNEQNPNIIIKGKITFSAAGNCTISGLELRTNGDYLLSLTGANACEVLLSNVNIVAENFSAIEVSNSNSESQLVVRNYFSDIQDVTRTLHVHTGQATIYYIDGSSANTALSAVASNGSAGSVLLRNVVSNVMYSTTSSGRITVNSSNIFTPQGIPFNLLNTDLSSSVFNGGSINAGEYDAIYIGNGSEAEVVNVKMEGGLTTGYLINGVAGGKLQIGGYSSVDNNSFKSFLFNPVLTTQIDVTVFGRLKLITPLETANGGTGLSSPGTAGNVLVSTGTVWQSASASIFPQMNDIAINTAASVNNGYNATAALTITLPPAPSQSDTIQIICSHAGPIVVTANTGQTIKVGNSNSSSGGTATNSLLGDVLTLRYLAASTTWRVVSSMGNWVLA